MARESCDGCKWYLGDGCCRINAEGECREGGGFELFEAAEPGAEAPGRLASASDSVRCADGELRRERYD